MENTERYQLFLVGRDSTRDERKVVLVLDYLIMSSKFYKRLSIVIPIYISTSYVFNYMNEQVVSASIVTALYGSLLRNYSIIQYKLW